MKKLISLSLSVLLGLGAMAQGNQVSIYAGTTTTPARNFIQATDEAYAVGVSTLLPDRRFIFGATNVYDLPHPPDVISLVANMGDNEGGKTPTSFLVKHIKDPQLDPTDGIIDFSVINTGLVGVGTLTPTSRLHVVNQQRDFRTDIPPSFIIDRTAFHHTSGPAYVAVSTTDFVVTETGQTGVGYTTPATQLDISDQNAPGNDLLRVGVYPPKAPALYVSNLGNVGIGIKPVTGGGAALLQVEGSGTFDGNLGVANDAYVDYDAHVGYDAYIGEDLHVTSSAEMNNLYVHASSYMTGNVQIQQSMSVARMVQIGSGSVAASSFTPNIYDAASNPTGYSLFVKGGILAERYKCALSSSSDWADYVFDKSYKLKPLSEVESYITANHHLPDVPSAAEVVCQGIDMAKMEATLLQKVEELTLYVLDLKKENESIKKQLLNLKK